MPDANHPTLWRKVNAYLVPRVGDFIKMRTQRGTFNFTLTLLVVITLLGGFEFLNPFRTDAVTTAGGTLNRLVRFTGTGSVDVYGEGTPGRLAKWVGEFTPPATTVNGSCGPAGQPVYDCSAGTSANNVDGSTAWTWACNGSGGGTNAPCTEQKDVGICSAVRYECQQGDPIELGGDDAWWTWKCSAPDGTASCARLKDGVTVGVCGPSGEPPFDCEAGTSANNVTGSAMWTWSCNGSVSSVSSDDAVCSERIPVEVTLSAAPACVVTDTDPIAVAWDIISGGGGSRDWIGMYRSGDDNTQYGEWFYTNGATDGTASFSSGVGPDNYVFRYLLDDGYESVAQSNTVRVLSPGESCSPDDAPTADLDIRKVGNSTWQEESVTIESGQHVELKWESDGDHCFGDTDFSTGGGNPPNGETTGPDEVSNEPTSGDKTYTVRCENDGGGSRTASATVNVSGVGGDPTITADPLVVEYGGTSLVTWNANGHPGCVVTGTNGDTIGSNPLTTDGNGTTESLFGETVYTISCSDSTSDNVTIRVRPQFEEI